MLLVCEQALHLKGMVLEWLSVGCLTWGWLTSILKVWGLTGGSKALVYALKSMHGSTHWFLQSDCSRPNVIMAESDVTEIPTHAKLDRETMTIKCCHDSSDVYISRWYIASVFDFSISVMLAGY